MLVLGIAGRQVGSQLLERVNEQWFVRIYKTVLSLIAIRLIGSTLF